MKKRKRKEKRKEEKKKKRGHEGEEKAPKAHILRTMLMYQHQISQLTT